MLLYISLRIIAPLGSPLVPPFCLNLPLTPWLELILKDRPSPKPTLLKSRYDVEVGRERPNKVSPESLIILNTMPGTITFHSASSSDSIWLLASVFHIENSRLRCRLLLWDLLRRGSSNSRLRMVFRRSFKNRTVSISGLELKVVSLCLKLSI